ncbi:hypothetical protein [Microbispora sp. NPDC049125]|uniref:hypothetical protein n=1 Tax=Microbispora sp. NPDC049125 TaxID=3154929 RepID=UPI003466E598
MVQGDSDQRHSKAGVIENLQAEGREHLALELFGQLGELLYATWAGQAAEVR